MDFNGIIGNVGKTKYPKKEDGMEILSKELGKGEAKCKLIVLPRDKKSLFPLPGVQFDLSDGTNTYSVRVDKQYRIRLTQWFNHHPTVKAGDRVTFSEHNSTISVALSGNGESKAWSSRELIGKETLGGKIVDIEHTMDGAFAVVQKTERVPLEKILNSL